MLKAIHGLGVWLSGLRFYATGALKIRIRFWGILYYTYNNEPPK